jgi:hypothetical protein
VTSGEKAGLAYSSSHSETKKSGLLSDTKSRQGLGGVGGEMGGICSEVLSETNECGPRPICGYPAFPANQRMLSVVMCPPRREKGRSSSTKADSNQTRYTSKGYSVISTTQNVHCPSYPPPIVTGRDYNAGILVYIYAKLQVRHQVN